jgi:hypothetical protein
MSWLRIVVPVAAAFFRGFVQGYAGQQFGRGVPVQPCGGRSVDEYTGEQPARALSSRRSDNLHESMRRLADAANMQLLCVEPGSVLFSSTFRGQTYQTLLMQTGDEIVLGTLSNITFPLGAIPQGVLSFIREMNNGTLTKCQYDFTKTQGKSCVCAVTRIAASELSASVLVDLRAHMVAAIWALDNFMLEEGYAQ